MQTRIENMKVDIFKIKNRRGYAAICCDNLTEGETPQVAYERMVKAVRRTSNKFRH